MRIVIKIVFILLMFTAFTSCYKKKKSREGIYVGEERYIRLHHTNSNDTLWDTTSLVILEVDMINRYRYRVWKPEVENSYDLEINATKVVRKDTVEGSRIGIPSRNWKISIDDGSLYLYLHEDNNWTGANEHYYFKGIKDY